MKSKQKPSKKSKAQEMALKSQEATHLAISEANKVPEKLIIPIKDMRVV